MRAGPAEPSNRGPARPAVIIVAVIGGWAAALAYAAGYAGTRGVQVTPAVAAEVGEAARQPAGFADVVEKIKPAVFGVRVRIDHEGDAGVTPESFSDESLPRMGRPKHTPGTGNAPRAFWRAVREGLFTELPADVAAYLGGCEGRSLPRWCFASLRDQMRNPVA